MNPRLALRPGPGWAKPSEQTYGPELDDEHVFWASYKVQLSPSFSLTPDVQRLADPATNPTEDRLRVFGLRAILSIQDDAGKLTIPPREAASPPLGSHAPNPGRGT